MLSILMSYSKVIQFLLMITQSWSALGRLNEAKKELHKILEEKSIMTPPLFYALPYCHKVFKYDDNTGVR